MMCSAPKPGKLASLGHQAKAKGLDNLDKVRRLLGSVTDRFAAFEAQALDVHVDFPLFQRLALPIPRRRGKTPGIKLQDTRMLRLMEVLSHTGTRVRGWRAAEIHQAILASFSLTSDRYSLTQLRYDLRKMKAHELLERDGRRYAYRLTDKGTRTALLFVLFHQRVCGPLANRLFHQRPTNSRPPLSKIEAAYRKADRALDQIIELLAA
jgi:hypothetical protein